MSIYARKAYLDHPFNASLNRPKTLKSTAKRTDLRSTRSSIKESKLTFAQLRQAVLNLRRNDNSALFLPSNGILLACEPH